MRAAHANESRVSAAFQRVIDGGFNPETVQGLSDGHIAEIAAAQDVSLIPEMFQEVLRLVGFRSGIWFAGSIFGFTALTGSLKTEAASLVPSGSDFGAPEEALMIFGHGGYEYHAISGADLALPDPPVWLIATNEDDEDDETDEIGMAQPTWPSVSAWFEAAAREVLLYRDELRSHQDVSASATDALARYFPAERLFNSK